MNFGQSVLQIFRPAVNPSRRTNRLDPRLDLHLLCIEGRGICGLTSLITLKEVLRQYQYLRKLPQLPRPCDVFDLVGGTGTGGIIAIMLFRLGMTVDEAIMAYTKLCEDVFSKKTVLQTQKKRRASLLENAIATVIRSSLKIDQSQAQKILMLDVEGPKCFVTASTAKNLSFPTLFRTYMPPRHASHNCTITEAIRATTAEDPFFPSIDIGDANLKEAFINGGLRLENPLKAVLEEAASIFPRQSISCVLSIGSGVQGIVGFKTLSTTELAKLLKKVSNDGDRISDEVAKDLSDRNVFYCRLNVDHGLEDIGFEDWERLGDVKTHTGKYLEKHDVSEKVSQLVQALIQRSAIASTIEETLRILSQFLDGLIFTVPGVSWTTIMSQFNRTVKASKGATETLTLQSALLRDTLESCMEGRDFVELPDELKGNIRQLLVGLKKTFQDSRGQEDPMTHVIRNIQKLLQRFWLQNHIAGNIAVHDILKYIRKDDFMKKSFSRLERHAMNQNLGNLNIAPFASYDSSEVSEKVSCFKGTRVKLLNEIASWIASDDPTLAPIYVLDGVAGIGKSTIAKTIAEHAAGINVLGASFFFSRNDDKRKTAKTFFPTIAYQLAYYDKDVAEQINEALLQTPHVVTQMPSKQFSTLIMEPLKESFAMRGTPILIVVDALDECELDGDVLMKIFADSIKNMPRLKLFITTRPEYHIRSVLDRYHHLKRFHLQDIEQSVVQSDIRLYLDFHLSENQVQDAFHGLQCIWKPAKKDMEVLIETCGTLFIIASTAVKFILDNKQIDPGKQLTWLLSGVSRHGPNHTTALDSFYTQILRAAVPSNDHDDWFGRYHVLVGTIIALQHPLPCVALSELVNLVPDDVKRTLSHLYSLVAPIGQDVIFRLHHKSFPDFVTSPPRCEQRFRIDLTTRHLELGKRCLNIMNSQLKPNICDLIPIDRFKDNIDIEHLTQDVISQVLSYACTHWATHLVNAEKVDGETERLLEDFARNHVLSWLEVLSIIGQMEVAYLSLHKICTLLDGAKTTAGITREIFHDSCRFIALNLRIIKVAAAHVWSAIAFSPQDTALYRTYAGLKRINLEVVLGYEKTWDPTISVMTGHSGDVKSVTFSEDGTKLASASADKTVRLWDGQTGAEIAVLEGHSGWVNSVVFSPDGTKLASASNDSTVRLWDGQTGTDIAVLRGHCGWVNTVVFSSNGIKLGSASRDGTVRLWDGQTGAEIAVLEGHTDCVNSVVFSPGGTKLVSTSADETVRLWDGQTGTEIATFPVKSVVFSPDGTKLAAASGDRMIQMWDGQTGAKIAVLEGHSAWVKSVAFSPDGTKLASASDDETVRLWDCQTGAEVAVLRRHFWPVYLVAFSPDGTRLASASIDDTVRLWDGQTGAEIAVLKMQSLLCRVKSVTFSPNGTKLAAAFTDNAVQLWDGKTGVEVVVLRGYSNAVESVFSPDGTRLASASDDMTVRLWDGAKTAGLQENSGWVYALVFSPDGTRLACALDDGRVWLLDSQTSAEIALLQGHSRMVNSMAFSPDGTKLASASYDRSLRLWCGQTGVEIAVLRGHLNIATSVVFSPDGTRLASASYDNTVRLWDGHTGAETFVFRGHSGWVNSVAFAPDGTKLASGSADNTVRLWDGQTGAMIAVLEGHSDRVYSLVFSPDCSKLASASRDGTTRLWDSQTGVAIASFPGFKFVAFALDGSTLVSLHTEEIYHGDCVSGDVLAMPLGMTISLPVEGVQAPGPNLWVIRVARKQRSLSGLLVVKIDEDGVLRFRSLCWFPPDLPVVSLAVSSLSRVAVACRNGRILLLDADFSSLL